MVRILDSRLRGSPQPLTLASPFVAVKVERDESGRPRLNRLSNALLSSPEDHLSQLNQSSERRLAQLRVGAWAMQNFHEHLACICAGRELMKGGASCKREFVEESELHACGIGRGFAAWETGSNFYYAPRAILALKPSASHWLMGRTWRHDRASSRSAPACSAERSKERFQVHFFRSRSPPSQAG